MSILRVIFWGVVLVFGYGYFFGGPQTTRTPNYVTSSPVSTGAPPPSATSQSGEMIATAINLSGNLCASVQAVVPLKLGGGDKVFEVECIEYRGGRGTVLYVVDTRNGSVIKSR